MVNCGFIKTDQLVSCTLIDICSSPSFRSPAAQQQQSRQLSRLNVQESLEHRQKRAEARYYLKWGFINIILLTLICADLWQTCLSMRSTLWYQVEFSVAVCISLSVAACAGKYFWWLCIDNTPLCVTEVQRCLLNEGNGKEIMQTIIPLINTFHF